jgi:TM2 domain-containing membrane protein YozV
VALQYIGNGFKILVSSLILGDGQFYRKAMGAGIGALTTNLLAVIGGK